MKKDTENKTPPSTGLSPKQKMLVGGVTFLFGAGLVLTGIQLSKKSDTPSPPDTEQVASDSKTPTSETASSQTEDAIQFVDKRDVLSESMLDDMLEQAYELAARGQWGEMVNVLEQMDTEYNLDAPGKAQELRNLFLDANTLVTLTQMGDTAEAVEAAVEALPRMETKEMFVLGLYYLPRNVILELSVDSLALAPTQRGRVTLEKRTDTPVSNEEGGLNEAIEKDDTIQRYFFMNQVEEFQKGFTRFDVLNYTVEEYVYVVDLSDETFGLVGFYSDDTNPANTTKTVSYYQDFNKDVEKGVEARYIEALKEYDEKNSEAAEEAPDADESAEYDEQNE